MKIVHYKKTPLAYAPDWLSMAINKYSEHESSVVTYPKQLPKPAKDTVVHFHNRFVPYAGPCLIQYHSEPDEPNLMHPKDHPTAPERRLVVAHYHPTLPEYKDMHPVRNVVDFRRPQFAYTPVRKFKVGYSPSVTRRISRWYDKGYEKTVQILQRVAKEVPEMEVDIIAGVCLDECLRRKRDCSVLIDECVTGSYHRSGLEGLALGKVTIAGMDAAVVDVFQNVSGSVLIPFTICGIDYLCNKLIRLSKDIDALRERGLHNRQWFENFWAPEQIVAEYVEHYKEVLA